MKKTSVSGKSFKKSMLCSSVTLLSAGVTSMAAFAAPLEEVYVTASKRIESVQDIPYNISAIRGSDLEAKGISDLTKLSRAVPGLAYSDKGAQGALISSGLVIRGINAEDSRSANPNKNAPVISTYINETPMFTNIRLVDIERVEVLRGPQGTLYGSGSLGGTLRYIQREPDPDNFAAKVTAEVNQVAEGDDMGWKTDLMLNIPLAEDMAVRVNLGKEEQGGFIDQPRMNQRNGRVPILADPSDPVNSPALFTSAEDVNDVEIESARIHFMMQTDKAIVNLAHHYQETTSGGSQRGLLGDELNSGALMPETYEGESNLTSLDIEYDLGFATLTANLSTYESENSGVSDPTGLYLSFPFYSDVYGSGPRPIIHEVSTWNEEANVAELRLNSESEGNIDWAIGLFYMNQDTVIELSDEYPGYTDYANACFDVNGFDPDGGPPCGLGTLGVGANNGALVITEENKDVGYISNSKDNFKDLALFGELTYHITEEWQATLGARGFDQKYTSEAIAGQVTNPGSVVDANAEFKEKDTLFKFNTSYDLSDDKMVYLTVSEGFRRGGANALGSGANEAVHEYDSDHTTNFELGLKGNIDYLFNYTIAAFYVDWTDIQLNTLCGDLALVCVVNAGDAESKGIEAQIEGNVSDRLSISASYTYADAELTSVSDQVAFTSYEILPGAQLPQSPETSASWGATYTVPQGNGMDLAYYIGGTYRGKTVDGITVNGSDIDPFTIWDAYVSLTAEQWSARLFVDNFTNEIGITGEESIAVEGPTARANISRPRLIGLNVQYSF